ncbi:MAG TPA: ABC transporter ATP-binding protein [Thermomicrobiaceae bacterium]|nr:ABC transporter ATP-binding protein [Thermomicrobiaceae bacterium]
MAPALEHDGLQAELEKTLGDFHLKVALGARPGEPVALLGPSGSGKSTVLRLLAGLLRPDSGRILVGEEIWFDADRGLVVPPERREVGMVFQQYVLFPHLTALENVAFGPRRQGMKRGAARELARRELERLGVGELAEQRPAQLSGGQQQRVALARALALEPELLLLDEPMAALDVLTRGQVRGELREVLAALRTPVVLVTHDPLDALVLARRIVVIEGGRILQDGSPDELLQRPRSPFVASLLGVNLIRGVATPLEDGMVAIDASGARIIAASSQTGDVHAAIRPWEITIHTRQPEGSARNVFAMQVAELVPLGRGLRVILRGAFPLVAEITPAAQQGLGLVSGATVWVSFKALAVDVYE